MRLYTRTDATTLDDPEYGHFEADEKGSFLLPEDLAERIRGFHLAGQPAWETDVERQRRLVTEEMERRRDPEVLLAAVEKLVQAAEQTGQTEEPAKTPKQPRARKVAQAKPE